MIAAQSEKFEIKTIGSKPKSKKFAGTTIAIKSFHGKYLTATPAGDISATAPHLKEWEKFQVNMVPNDKTQVGFRNWHGKYVSANPNGKMEKCSTNFKGWEWFIIEKSPEKKMYTIKTPTGKYLSAQPNGVLTADKAIAQSWEWFTIEKAL
ncbi:hypothetical protein EIN_515000 [Entamoeba invadens IP1]|nr:hypothetical protein EIN_515000 [Entamoeba invadens IP1]ELP87080.1 hypothetical protein EIN_515000 [Entamoeba invadens IP1]|eukprot:XP_004253851.1 hypothetical protein EIN_515000 [Entamoeba invadens IP1]